MNLDRLGRCGSISSRRRFLAVTGTAAAWASVMHLYPEMALGHDVDLAERIRGLVFGSAIGDALGGPIEFQSRERVQLLAHPPKVWQEGEKLDANARASAAARLRLRP